MEESKKKMFTQMNQMEDKCKEFKTKIIGGDDQNKSVVVKDVAKEMVEENKKLNLMRKVAILEK